MERKFKGQSLFAFPSDYTVVDIETNGLVSGVCEIIEVSALKVRGEKIRDSFSSLIKPTDSIDWFITNLTGITDEMVKNAPDVNEVMQNFYRDGGFLFCDKKRLTSIKINDILCHIAIAI